MRNADSSVDQIGWGTAMQITGSGTFIANWSYNPLDFTNSSAVNLFKISDTGKATFFAKIQQIDTFYSIFNWSNSFILNFNNSLSCFGLMQFKPLNFSKAFFSTFDTTNGITNLKYYRPTGIADSLV